MRIGRQGAPWGQGGRTSRLTGTSRGGEKGGGACVADAPHELAIVFKPAHELV